MLLTSTTDTEGETVTLTEVPDLPGTFRGSISTMNASRILVDEDLLEDRIAQLRIEYPDHNVEVLRTRARGQLAQEAINNPPTQSSFRSDGVLQTVAGDVVTVTYDDVLNDYGNAETLVTTAVYGGWSGSVSGTWTAAGNPYVVTGDMYVDNGQSLTVEAGVEVRFYGEYYFYVYGSLSAEGTEGDSIYFRNHVDEDDVLDWYSGLYINLYYDQENIMSHVSLDGSSNAGLTLVDYKSTEILISHSTFQNNGWAGCNISYFYGGHETPMNIADCRFINNNVGMYIASIHISK